MRGGPGSGRHKSEIDDSNYKFTHGRAPKGHGSWAFGPKKNTDVSSPDMHWEHNKNYSDAKKSAAAWGGENGHDVLHVQT